MLAIINTAMSQTHAAVPCLLASWAPSYGTIVFQQVPDSRCNRVMDLEDIEVVHVSLQSPTPQEAQP